MSKSDLSVQVYLVDPVVESRDPGEDGGFLLIIAAQSRDKAGDAMNLPDALRVLTVQGPTGVPLDIPSQPHILITDFIYSRCEWLGFCLCVEF